MKIDNCPNDASTRIVVAIIVLITLSAFLWS